MTPRLDYARLAPEAYRSLAAIHPYLDSSSIEKPLRYLVELRVSQLNGCSYCLDLHSNAARSVGVPQQLLDCLPAWKETDLYSERQRAALLWAEAVTQIENNHAPDALYEEVRGQFSEQEMADLTFAIAAMNAWNRLAISLRKPLVARRHAETNEAGR
jgi:AhpD family alkylhydroperoxidase